MSRTYCCGLEAMDRQPLKPWCATSTRTERLTWTICCCCSATTAAQAKVARQSRLSVNQSRGMPNKAIHAKYIVLTKGRMKLLVWSTSARFLFSRGTLRTSTPSQGGVRDRAVLEKSPLLLKCAPKPYALYQRDRMCLTRNETPFACSKEEMIHN